MYGGLYFPIFLLSVGLFTLMYMDSFMVLSKLFSSLPIILKSSIIVSWPLLSWCTEIGDGDFKCSLNEFNKCNIIKLWKKIKYACYNINEWNKNYKEYYKEQYLLQHIIIRQTFSHTDLRKLFCWTAKACQCIENLILLLEKSIISKRKTMKFSWRCENFKGKCW